MKVTVGKTESCDFTTIQAAIDCLSKFTDKWQEIIILPGEYRERIRLIGQRIKLIGLGQVEIKSNLSARQLDESGVELGTFRTATCFVNGNQIKLINLKITNDAGLNHSAGQALAVYAEGTEIEFTNCYLNGYQDTLFLGPLPSYQKNGTHFMTDPVVRSFTSQNYRFDYCRISGTIDFIFGGGNASFNHCQIKVKGRQGNEPAYVTAASTPEHQTGFVFNYCTVTSETKQPYFLGRPWREFAKTKYDHCFFDNSLEENGWHDWNKTSNQQTVTYVEQHCFYEQRKVKRASWVHYHE